MISAGITRDRLIHIKGDDYLNTHIPEATMIEKNGGSIVITPRHSSHSSSSSIGQRLQEVAMQHANTLSARRLAN